MVSRREMIVGLSSVVTAAAQGRAVQTVTGPVAKDKLGVTLMHEHIVTDLRAPAERRKGDYDPNEAFETALPYLDELVNAGAATLVEPTPINIGRAPSTLQQLSRATGLQIVCATGIYGAANHKFIPNYAREQCPERLAERYAVEAKNGIAGTGVHPGIIKTGVNRESPLPEIERKLVTAALLGHKLTGLTVASHTGGGPQALEQLKIANEVGVDPVRVIWVHAQNEKDPAIHVQAAREGMWVEFDGLRQRTLNWHLTCVKTMADAGLLRRTLVSHDAGWYRPGIGGDKYRGYTFLFEHFIPALRAEGFTDDDVRQLLVTNPATALAG